MRLKSLVKLLECTLMLGSGLCHAQDGDALKLWYRQPAGAWTQALPVGNGRLAAMVFERSTFTPSNSNTPSSGHLL